mgnify:CR=1 FL=1
MSGISINSNLNAVSAQRNLNQASGSLNERLEQLASALEINDASDDAAGLAISEGLRSQIRGASQALQNTQDGISLIQTAEGGAEVVTDNLQRIRELSLQAANGSLGDSERGIIQEEVNQLVEQIDSTTEQVEFNGRNLLNGDISEANGGAEIQSGANRDDTVNLTVEAQDSNSLGVQGVDLTTAEGAQQAVEDTTNAINQVSTERAELGAQQNRLESTVDFLQITEENQQASESRIRDADLAEVTTERAADTIRTQSSASVLAQANNLQGQSALQLLG